MTEVQLKGGQINQVSRDGDTVLRPPSPATPTIQRLLQHMRTRGLDWVPEPRGFAPDGREQLGFIPGQVPHDMPEWIWREAVLKAVAQGLRQFHEATIDFAREGATWRYPPSQPEEVICHNDFAPYNLVFADRALVGVIDFDVCAPGPRLRDLAYAAYRMVPLMAPRRADREEGSTFSESETDRRLGLFLDAYAGSDAALRYPAPVLWSAAAERLAELADWTRNFARAHNRDDLLPDAEMYSEDSTFQAQRARTLVGSRHEPQPSCAGSDPPHV